MNAFFSENLAQVGHPVVLCRPATDCRYCKTASRFDQASFVLFKVWGKSYDTKNGDFCTPKNQLFWIILVAILDHVLVLKNWCPIDVPKI